MYKVIEFYEPLLRNAAEQRERGQIWWACDPYTFTSSHVTRIRLDPTLTERVDVRLFDPRQEPANARAGTEAGEFLAITKIKRRPVVILSTAGTEYHDRAWRGGEFFLVIPMRSLRNPLTNEYKADPDFVWGVMSYQYNSVFYLPSSAEFNIRESVLQFDRIKALHKSWLLNGHNASLTSDAMICLDEWLRNYIHGKVRARFNEDLETYRQMIGEDPQIRAGVFGQTRP